MVQVSIFLFQIFYTLYYDLLQTKQYSNLEGSECHKKIQVNATLIFETDCPYYTAMTSIGLYQLKNILKIF